MRLLKELHCNIEIDSKLHIHHSDGSYFAHKLRLLLKGIWIRSLDIIVTSNSIAAFIDVRMQRNSSSGILIERANVVFEGITHGQSIYSTIIANILDILYELLYPRQEV